MEIERIVGKQGDYWAHFRMQIHARPAFADEKFNKPPNMNF